MKLEIPEKRPAHYEEFWPGSWELFSHYEFTAGVPSAIFVITTLKENGKVNACLHSWSSFVGDGPNGFFAVMPGLMQHTHTYANVLREREFCINFLPASQYPAMLKTIEENHEDVDELEVAGLHAEAAKLVKPPRIAEAFMCYECKLHSHQDISGAGFSALLVGRVVHAAVEKGLRSAKGICSPDSFMMNIHSPMDPETGKNTDKDKLAHLRLNAE